MMFVPSAIMAQGSEAIDRMFDKYSGKEGITSVYISSKMFSMMVSQEQGEKEVNDLLKQLKSIRILSVEDTLLNQTLNFYEELKRTVDFSSYEELMTVNENNSVTKFLIMETGSTVTELLVISGGKQGNTLISIKGDLDMKNISELSRKMGIEQLGDLEKLEKETKKNKEE